MSDEIPNSPNGPDTEHEVSKSEFWNTIYKEQESPRWNIKQPAPALKHWIKTTNPARGRVLIPSCGYGHDVRLLAESGFEAVGVDFAELAIQRAMRQQKDAGGKIEWRQADIFDLAKTDREGFDYIYEYTCFVAIKPQRRPEFAQLEHDLLKPGGRLVGCFYNHGREGGPPFDVTREQVLEVYEPKFEIQKLEIAAHSIERRQGKELWAEFLRK